MTSDATEHLLLVEDNPDEAALIRRALAARGWAQLTVLTHGQRAIDYLLRRGAYAGRSGGDPALVLLDIGLPDISGLEVLETIRAHAALRHVPVVMLTVSDDEAVRAGSFETGANLFVTKPSQPAELTATVHAIGTFLAEQRRQGR
ncbi:response regulator [Deinococcus sonorensis]|uniref:Response regulator n=2 Tax=Deinococcus sonorensis TaxID=309891 RepID=A0AAU7U632_9DEIO